MPGPTRCQSSQSWWQTVWISLTFRQRECQSTAQDVCHLKIDKSNVTVLWHIGIFPQIICQKICPKGMSQDMLERIWKWPSEHMQVRTNVRICVKIYMCQHCVRIVRQYVGDAGGHSFFWTWLSYTISCYLSDTWSFLSIMKWLHKWRLKMGTIS